MEGPGPGGGLTSKGGRENNFHSNVSSPVQTVHPLMGNPATKCTLVPKELFIINSLIQSPKKNLIGTFFKSSKHSFIYFSFSKASNLVLKFCQPQPYFQLIKSTTRPPTQTEQ